MIPIKQKMIWIAPVGNPETGHRPLDVVKKLAATWKTLAQYVVPIGDQDESGFHYGGQAAPAPGRH